MNGNSKKLGLIIGIYGVLAVVLGAFGAHSLKSQLSAESLMTYNTGITYHFYHLFAMIAAYFSLSDNHKWAKWSFICFAIGVIFFSGSIYLLATRDLIGLTNYKWLGPITPIGGLFFILGWIFLGMSFYNQKVTKQHN